MKHIYLFSSDSRAGDYGIGTYIRELTECIKGERDVRLSLVELQSIEKEFSIVESEGIRTIKIPSPRLVPYWQLQPGKMELYNLAVSCLLKSQIDKDEDNVFHLNYLQHDSLVPYLRKLYPSCKIVFTIHYMGWLTLIKGDKACFKKIIQKEEMERTDVTEKSVYDDYYRTKAMCQSVDNIVCLSFYTFDILQTEYEIHQEQLTFISNGLKDEAVIVDERQKRAIKKELSFNENEKIVLFVGRLDEEKGLLLLLKAFERIVVHSSDVHLIIAGSGNYDRFLKECISFYGRVTFTGRVDKGFLYKLYQIADVGVHPSLNEQCSYVAIEMMMHGIPLVGIDSAGIGEMIESGYNGYKVCGEQEPLSATSEQNLQIEQLGKRTLEILQDDELRQKLSANSRVVYRNRYKDIKMKNKILEVYLK
ncbi:TIGR04157 family glycosyltransferase [uncultured Bacteroides sp.]|uniref:TIGR04157 family glycosyltransferase n=1 Tax=uncultured Bacteroides sp. TaxID=162156 RepID=UPI0026760510|nr:TIGR04157 family glycosyltransferase [uncultured Bacteroides sp.]